MVAKVYFADMRAHHVSMLDKLEKLFDAAGFGELIAPRDLVAVKVHFGERGNTGYVRPQYIRRVVNKIKARGGKPFITDANTLYVGSRANAVDHLQTALENGFAYAVVEAPLIIADGLNGKDYVSVPVNLKHFKEVKIGSAVYHADAMIVISHFKGHEITGFGGALKNVGMGTGARSGKQMMHSDVLPQVNPEKCVACERCHEWCPAGAIEVKPELGKAVVDEKTCLGCGECTVTCPEHAIAINWKTTPDVIQEKIVEYTVGAVKNKRGKVGYINFIMDVSPDCDCYGWSDAPLVRNIGILASLDPVALDQACIDLVLQEKALPGSRAAEKAGTVDTGDVFRVLHPEVDWSVQLAYGEQVGLGTRKYELIKIEK